MKARLAMIATLVVVAMVGAPAFVSAVDDPTEGLGVVPFNGVNPESASILVSPNHATTGLAANTPHRRRVPERQLS